MAVSCCPSAASSSNTPGVPTAMRSPGRIDAPAGCINAAGIAARARVVGPARGRRTFVVPLSICRAERLGHRGVGVLGFSGPRVCA
eukprot:scaffold9899_cov122-Isochrysis_galbana.AAC.1